jgi:hypothetical protein
MVLTVCYKIYYEKWSLSLYAVYETRPNYTNTITTIRAQVRERGIFGGQSGSGKSLSLNC